MREQRDTLDVTLDNYDIPIRTLLEHFGDPPKQLNAQRLRQCFLNYSDGKSYAMIKHCATALRMFVRFLIAEGRCPVGLEAAIPLVPYWRLSSLPRYLQPEEVERTVASCDRATSMGKRDRAILLLLDCEGAAVVQPVDLEQRRNAERYQEDQIQGMRRGLSKRRQHDNAYREQRIADNVSSCSIQ